MVDVHVHVFVITCLTKYTMGALLYHPMTCYDSGCEYGSVSCMVDQDLMDHIHCMYLTPKYYTVIMNNA